MQLVGEDKEIFNLMEVQIDNSLSTFSLFAIKHSPNARTSMTNSTTTIITLEGLSSLSGRSVSVGYHEKPIIHDLDWTIMPGEHWQLSGPNGCGKSTLVNLISGDHPQCYSNEIHLFGSQRGKGESIWDIKRHMGLMSTALHQQYRVSVIVETVLLSGFFDSIGVYRSVSQVQKDIVSAWLGFVQMESYFKKALPAALLWSTTDVTHRPGLD